MLNSHTISIIKGEAHVFERVYRLYVRTLFLCAVSWCGNEVIAQEAVQEGFVKLWEGRHRLDPHYDVKHYLLRSIRNYILNHQRHLHIRDSHQQEMLREELHARHEVETVDNRIGKIRSLLNELPDECRKTFMLAVINGLTYEETALEMGVSKNTVKTQIRIAYKKLRDAFDIYLFLVF